MRLGEMSTDTGQDNKFLYNGKEFNDEYDLDLYHYRARNYNPQLGKWLQIDPADEFFSPYVYCHNDPISYKDSNGFWEDQVDNGALRGWYGPKWNPNASKFGKVRTNNTVWHQGIDIDVNSLQNNEKGYLIISHETGHSFFLLLDRYFEHSVGYLMHYNLNESGKLIPNQVVEKIVLNEKYTLQEEIANYFSFDKHLQEYQDYCERIEKKSKTPKSEKEFFFANHATTQKMYGDNIKSSGNIFDWIQNALSK